MGVENNDGVADRLTVTLAEVGPLSFYCGESDKLAADSISASEPAPFASLQHCLSNISSADSPHKLQSRKERCQTGIYGIRADYRFLMCGNKITNLGYPLLWTKLLGTCKLRNRDLNFNEIGTK